VPLRGHNDTLFGWQNHGRPIDCPEVGHTQGIFGVFSYYQLAMLFLNMVCLTVVLAYVNEEMIWREDDGNCDGKQLLLWNEFTFELFPKHCHRQWRKELRLDKTNEKIYN
jgi:hypothetical protein